LADYDAYEDARRRVFDQPFGRAAGWVDGLIWRIAMDSIALGVALRGPSKLAREFGDLVADPTGKQFVNDNLSEDEMDLICGKWVIYTGQGGLFQVVRSFPFLKYLHAMPGKIISEIVPFPPASEIIRAGTDVCAIPRGIRCSLALCTDNLFFSTSLLVYPPAVLSPHDRTAVLHHGRDTWTRHHLSF